MCVLNGILHHYLGVHKRFGRWTSHQLTVEQKEGRVLWSLTTLEKYVGRPKKDVKGAAICFLLQLECRNLYFAKV